MRLLLAMSLCATAFSATAEEMPVVVELFTAQGCSACPPADEIMQQLTEMEDVIALALHVDYWDYIGWPDSFASPAHTARQKAYARSVGERMIYTPQMIVNGQDRVVGADAMAVMERLHARTGATTSVVLRLEREGESLRIEARAEGPVPPLTVQLVRYMPSKTVEIAQGENAGLTIDYRNVVTEWSVVGEWSGEGTLSLTVPAPGEDPAVVILQEHGPGRIRAAKAAP